MKTGLVLEGGGMRGMYTEGVLDVMLDNQIHFDGVIGVSAGALFGVNFLSGQKKRALRYSKKYNGDKDYMGIRPLLREGNIVSTRLAYEKIPKEWDKFDDEAFQKSGVPFYAVVTDIETGKPEYIRIESGYEQMDTLRASGSMPFVSKPVEINGKKYLDGGITDSIPVEKFQRMGYDRIVVVLTRNLGYRKEPMSPLFWKYTYRKYPHLRKCLKERHNMYNSTIQKIRVQEREKKLFVVRPSQAIQISRVEKSPENLQRVYDLGVADMQSRIGELKRYLKGEDR